VQFLMHFFLYLLYIVCHPLKKINWLEKGFILCSFFFFSLVCSVLKNVHTSVLQISKEETKQNAEPIVILPIFVVLLYLASLSHTKVFAQATTKRTKATLTLAH